MKLLGRRFLSRHRATWRSGKAAMLLCAVLALAGAGATDTAGANNSPAPLSRPAATVVTVGRAPEENAVPGGFVGMSLEYGTVADAERAGPGGADPVLAQLIRNLAPGQTPILRIGGDSTDWTWWPVGGMKRPHGVTFNLTPDWIGKAKALATSAGARLILGINLETNSTTIASTEARHLVDGIGRPRIEALEVGNEPELYSALPWYHTRAGDRVFGRPPTYNVNDYASEFGRVAKTLPAVPLAGPSTGSKSWVGGVRTLIAADPLLRMMTFHAYALDPAGDAFRGHNCSTARSDTTHPTVPGLLAAYASKGLLHEVAPSVALAHQHGLRFRLDEMNAVTCAGTRGVSNASASALWALDALFVLAEAGVDGLNIHTWRGSVGKLFNLHYRHHRWVGSVRPEYYGLLMFARAAPRGSRLLPVAQSNPRLVRSWAVLGPDHSLRVVLINDDISHGRWVVVRPPGPAGEGQLERLNAPSAYARSGVTLAGQSFAQQTTTGLLAGPLRVSPVRPAGGEYVVRVPAASAALLSFSTATRP